MTDYIDGKDFFSLGIAPTEHELDKVVTIAAKLQSIDYRPPFVYDTWAINNFVKEFESKEQNLEPKYLELVQPIYKRFKNFDYDSLPKRYVHGDMIVTNLIKDQNDKIWLVDYSVANYAARLNEIAVICCDVAIVQGNEDESRKRIERTFNKWCDLVNATATERDAFWLFLDVANAIHIMNSAIEKQQGNLSAENEYFLHAGLFGLKLYERRNNGTNQNLFTIRKEN